MSSKKKLTPLMQQYWEVKSAHEDKVLLFRMGDFFEMFHDDAVKAAPLLGIALTQRNKKSEDNTPMCGVPHHSIAGPINKLLDCGLKIAICDQIEDPKEAKGIVKRAVTRILSPGMVYDPDTLDEASNNYLCAYDDTSLSFLETTTGEAFFYRTRSQAEREKLLDLLSPKELLIFEQDRDSFYREKALDGPYLSVYEEGETYDELWPESANRLLSYAVYMQGEELRSLIQCFEERALERRMELPATVLRHLEVFENYRGDVNGTLFTSIQRTKSSAGTRLLKQWMRFPLTDTEQIDRRLNEIELWQERPSELKALRSLLGRMGDIERRLGKVSNPQCHPRDLLAIAQSLQVGLQMMEFLPHWALESESLEKAHNLVEEILKTLVEEPPAALKKGGFVREGLRADLDELIHLSSDVQKNLMELEAREKETTGIPSLKVRYNNVFGYYIEVTNTHKDKVPGHYIRKQTLTNAERYVTDELNNLEAKILSAKTRKIELELEVFSALKKKVLLSSAQLLGLSQKWSQVDVLTSLAWLAMENNYCRPSFTHGALGLVASRHPVVEQEVKKTFIPNDITLDQNHCLLLTGPNMAGKSTLMRQVAITAILAQMGAFVPADRAELPIFERIFTRIGASDFLAEGLSTFMVEMTETAEMLREANEKSLVILDEVGRGTSTFDGMSLAQAILEYLLESSKAMTFFATHYHELTELDQRFRQVINAHMAIEEKGKEIHFLHTLVKGGANRSYGIQVARLAGLPASVTKRAGQILRSVESSVKPTKQMSLMELEVPEEEVDSEKQKLIEDLKEFAVQNATPLQALNKIAQWQQSLS